MALSLHRSQRSMASAVRKEKMGKGRGNNLTVRVTITIGKVVERSLNCLFVKGQGLFKVRHADEIGINLVSRSQISSINVLGKFF